MTLLLTCLCDDFVVQVTDRRFTPNVRGPVNDEGNKQVVVRSGTLQLVMGFTGLASVTTSPDANGLKLVSTGMWLAQTVARSELLERGTEACAEALGAEATAAFRHIAESTGTKQMLAVVLAGYHRGDTVPRLAVVTNFATRGGRVERIDDAFRVETRFAVGREFLPYGITAALPQDTRDRIRAALKRRDYPAVTDVAVEQIRKAARHGKHGKYVGRNCMSVCITRAGEVESIYHPEHGRSEIFGPNVVEAKHGGVMMIGAPYAAKYGPNGGLISQTLPGAMHVGPSGTAVRDRRGLSRSRRTQR